MPVNVQILRNGHRLDVDDTVDIQTLTTRVLFEVYHVVALDPPTSHHRIVQRVSSIHE